MPLTPQSAPAPAGALADDVAPVRLTSTPTVSRTAAATAARRRAHVGRLALELSARLDDLDNERLHTLAWFLREECRRRGIT